MSRFEFCLKEVLQYEGGFVNHPKDPGGATNKGVTIGTFRLHYPGSSIQDLLNITDEQVALIYKKGYWDKIDGDGLGPGVDLAVFDYAVNSGVGRARKEFRKVMKFHRVDDKKLVDLLCSNRLSFLKGLSIWSTFGKGWSRRVERVRLLGMRDAGTTSVTKVSIPKPEEAPAKGFDLLTTILDFIMRIFFK